MIRVRVANMTCGGCAGGVAATLRAADPAAEASFDLDRREVSIAHPSRDAAALAAALAADHWQAERLPG